MNVLNRYADPVYCITRLLVGLMFACHGGQKILNFPPGAHAAPTDALSWVGAIIELVGGFLIAFGLLTRVAAFFASGEMAVAYFYIHLRLFGWMPLVNMGERSTMFCFAFLYMAARGSGIWSLDSLMRSGKRV